MNPFTSADDLDALLRFRQGIEAGDNSFRSLVIDATRSCACRGLAIARWVGELAMPWPRFAQRLDAGLEGVPDEMVVLPLESIMLPGGRGRLVILNGEAAGPAGEEERQEFLRRVAVEQGRRWWSVFIASGCEVNPREGGPRILTLSTNTRPGREVPGT